MKRSAAVLLVLATTALLPARAQETLTFPAHAVGVSMTALRELVTSYSGWRLADDPEAATGLGDAEYNDRWRDWSPAARRRAQERRREFLPRVQDVENGDLTDSDRLTAELMEYELTRDIEADRYLLLVDSVSPLGGPNGSGDFPSPLTVGMGAQNRVFATIQAMPARTVSDYENILARLRALPAYADGLIALWRSQLGAKLAQPTEVVDAVVRQIGQQRMQPADESPLLAAFRRFPDDIAPAERARLQNAATTAYDTQFVPAWTRLERFLTTTMRPAARAQDAIASLPNGAEAYAILVRYATTTRDTPQQIHEIGLQMVAALEHERPASTARAAGVFPMPMPPADAPAFRWAFRSPAFADGWELYAHGQRSDDLLASARLVADTGIHALGWSRQRALDYFTEHTSADGSAEVDRLVAWPGLSLAAKVGELRIRALEARARQQLGLRFDAARFRTAVADGGDLPLDLLEQQVNAYVADTKGTER